MPYTLFLDESGDHTLNYAGRPAPNPPEFFLLCGCLFDDADVPGLEVGFEELKRRHLIRPDAALVSRRIRRWERDFAFLADPARRVVFLEELTQVIQAARCTIFGAGIDKYRHWTQYGAVAISPYDLSLAFIMERVLMCVGDRGGGSVRVVAEARGRDLDAELQAEFARIRQEGTRYVAPARMQGIFPQRIWFDRKANCVSGLELADLAAYPLSQRLCYPASRSPAFEVIYTKLHQSPRGVWGAGLKVFPSALATDFGL